MGTTYINLYTKMGTGLHKFYVQKWEQVCIHFMYITLLVLLG